MNKSFKNILNLWPYIGILFDQNGLKQYTQVCQKKSQFLSYCFIATLFMCAGICNLSTRWPPPSRIEYQAKSCYCFLHAHFPYSSILSINVSAFLTVYNQQNTIYIYYVYHITFPLICVYCVYYTMTYIYFLLFIAAGECI